MLTPRGARCSTPPVLKASFRTGGVCYRRRGGGAYCFDLLMLSSLP
ncbi:hypothetical protein AB2I91_24300 [Escherichia coli]